MRSLHPLVLELHRDSPITFTPVEDGGRLTDACLRAKAMALAAPLTPQGVHTCGPGCVVCGADKGAVGGSVEVWGL
jgi:hypothetical protein